MRSDDWTPAQWADYYGNLAQKNYMAFQETGESRYDRAYFKYDLIAEAFRAKAERDGEHEADIRKRITNCDHVIGTLIPGKVYNRDEVAKLLKNAVWW